ncbi:hypothetical protein [uncultured Jatrophihabitans sp.]|uniref:hypothetical protein n=1 Tax=uncultured Jatrophihabitans sp. TaxID=1610747 RepID=UPI0035CA88BC
MFSSRRRVVLVLPLLALTGAIGLTSCTSGSSHAGKTRSAGTASAAARPAAGGRSVAPATLAATLQQGLSGATSARLVVSSTLGSQTLRGSGDVGLSNGTISRADLQQQLPSGLGSLRIVVVGDRTYAKLPGALNTSGKPWVLLDPDSKSLVVSQLASTVAPVLAVAAPASLVTFARSASSVTDLGRATTSGVATTHYRVTVDTSTLPSSVPSSITGGGKSPVPVDMYLDASGRPRRVSGTFSISGQSVTPTIVLSDYNAPVTVTAPPSDEVSTR